jgi:hypothetical protein
MFEHFFKNPNCPECRISLPIPYKGGDFVIVVVSEGQPLAIRRPVSKEELEDWRKAYMAERREMGSHAEDELLLEAVWNKEEKSVEKLLEKKTPQAITGALEIALRLNHTTIFQKLLQAHRSKLDANLGTNLLLFAASLTNESALTSLCGCDFLFQVPPYILYDAAMKVWKGPTKWEEDSLKIVKILSKKLYVQYIQINPTFTEKGWEFLYKMLEQALEEKDPSIIDAIISCINDCESIRYQFVCAALRKSWSDAILAGILSAPGEDTFSGICPDLLIAETIHRAVEYQKYEIFCLLLRRRNIVDATQADTLWKTFSKDSTVGSIVDALKAATALPQSSTV